MNQQFVSSQLKTLQDGVGLDHERISDRLEEIIKAVEHRQDFQRRSFEDFSTNKGGSINRQSVGSETLGGPLVAPELSQLQMLCSAVRPEVGFSGIDGDILTTIAQYLHEHVTSAANIDLVKDVHKIVAAAASETGKSSSKSTTSLVDKVRFFKPNHLIDCFYFSDTKCD